MADNKNVVYIYYGPGAAALCVMNTAYLLKSCISQKYIIKTLQPSDIISGEWIKDAALLIMPGGADIYYVEHLTVRGNIYIKDYISAGGSYLGFCAGSYYAGSFIEWDLGKKYEVKGERDLSLFPGIVRGPCLKPYNYTTFRGAGSAEIKVTYKESVETLKVFYNGGGAFIDAHCYENVEIIATYTAEAARDLAAIITFKYGKGTVILSGPHPENGPELLDSKDKYLHKIALELRPYEQQRMKLMRSLLITLGLSL
jgi:glutamine amidotransferase-like uncharacterized protein